MIASAHVAAGAVAGVAGAQLGGKWPWRLAAAFALGLLSHAVLDALPHSDYASLSRSTILWVASLETVGMSAVAGHITRRRLVPHWPWYLLLGVAGATLPDAKFIAPTVFPREIAEPVVWATMSVHSYFHAPDPPSPAFGLVVEVVVTIACLAALVFVPLVRHVRPTVPSRSHGVQERNAA